MLKLFKPKPSLLVIVLAFILTISVISVVGAVDSSTPSISAFSPGEGETVSSSDVTVSFTVSDPDLIAQSDYYIKVNGSLVAAEFNFRGHVEYDACSGTPYWVNDGYDQATISGTVTGLQDGPQSVEVKAVDRLGNGVVHNWSFNVAAKPVFSDMTPANGSTAVINNLISVRVLDNSQVDPGSINLIVDSNPVSITAVSFNSATGLVSYSIPAPGLSIGAHTVSIDATDIAGNAASATWSFTVDSMSQPLTFADSSKTFATASPELNVVVKSNARLDSAGSTMTVDGQPVPVNFTYKGHWDYPFELDPEWRIDSYYEATVSGTPAGLTDGPHTIAVTAKDIVGNQFNGQWNFTVNALPVFSAPYPVNGNNTTDNAGFSVSVSDNDAVIPTSIIINLDGAPVPAAYDSGTGNISYQPAGGIANGPHTVTVSAQDITGNTANFAWSFTVQTIGPDLTFANDGQTFDTYQPALIIAAKSNVKIVSAAMKIDGQPVEASFIYKGHWEYPVELDPEWAVDSYNEGTLNYIPPAIGDGIHEMVVTATDVLGNQSAKTFNFTVAQTPVFSGIEPLNGVTVMTQKPVIKAIITDPNGPAIDKASIRLTIDNNQVVPTVTETDGAVTVTLTPNTLANDAYHNISLTAADTVGNTNSVSWRFYINIKGEMTVDAKACGSCHTLNQYDKYIHSEGPLGIGVGHSSPTHFYGQGCGHCHGGYNSKTCGYCHNGDISLWWDGDGWVRPEYVPDPTIAAGQDCTFCHSLNNGGWVPSSYPAYHYYWISNMVNTGAEPLQPAYPDIPLTVVHDLMPLHKIEKGSCNECHSIYLTREHNKFNSSGVQMTCATCHSSINPAVQQAITTKNRDCLACHTQADHEAVHNGGLDANCQTCHSATLSVEHLNNSTTAGKNYSCDTCHTSTAKEVKRTIAADSLNCAGCHQEGHNLYFVDKVPADIPLYSGFLWALPIEAAIFAGEPSAPADYDSGQVVMSNRQTDLTAANIWTFYNLQLGANGWTLNAGAPAAGADYFAAEFVKGGRYVTVKCFNTENSSGAGQPVSTGYRLEIWYK